MMEESLDVQELFFTNLQLLGFNVERMEAQVKIPFNKNMFDLPNRRGAEEILYFLFSRLHPVMCKEEFRNCWPIGDKQQEQMFRRVCNNWLSNINKEEPEAMLPRISPSLFLTPGGAKFYQLLYRFSRYVILQVSDKENGMKDSEKHRYPTLTPENKELADNMADTMIGCVIRGRNSFLYTSNEIVSLNRQWKDQSNEMVKEYRKLNKEIRDTELKIRDQIQKSSEMSAARGSPVARKRRSKSYEPDFDPKSTQRSQKVHEVRSLWKQLDGFLVSEASEREVIESIVDRSLTKYRIDSAHIPIKVPDLLLRECEKEIRKRHVDNTFHHGKLNLVSLLQLWNLCLHLLQDRFQTTGVPDFTKDIEKITTLAHSNHSLLLSSQSLQREIEGVLPELKQSVDRLRGEVEQEMSATPTQLRTTAVGLGLVEPTPEVSFSPASTLKGRQPTAPSVALTQQECATPEAVARISEDIAARVNRVQLFSDSPRISQLERPAVSTKLPRKLATTQRNKPRDVDRTKPRVVDVRGQLQSTPTKPKRDQVHVEKGLKALDLKQDISLNDISDGVLNEPSTLVQRDLSISGLNDSTLRNSSTRTPTKYDSNVKRGSFDCDKTPNNDKSGGNRNHNGTINKFRDLEKSPSDLLVDEMFGETPKGSPLGLHKSPSDYLLQEVLSSGVLNSPFVRQTDMSHFSEAGGKSENEGQKVGVCVERSIEDLQRSLQEMKASGDFSKGSLSPGQVQRPHSPVAEFLDHLEFEPLERSQVILEKQVDALSDLESSKSSQELEASDKENIPILLMPTTDNLLSDQQSSRSHYSAEQSDEEVDHNLQGIYLITSPGIPIIKDSGHHESPLSEDIRKIYREAIGRGESSPARALDRHSHSDIFDELSSIAEKDGNLESIEMPVFGLNDSGEDIMDKVFKIPTIVNSPTVRQGQRPPVGPGSDNIHERVKNLSERVSDLNGNPVHHNNMSGAFDRITVDRQLSRDWEDLELSMEVLDDLMGKSPDCQKSPILHAMEENFFTYHQHSAFQRSPPCPKPKDNSTEGFDLSDELDESFVPFKEGFSVEGGTTPAKTTTQNVSEKDKDGNTKPSSSDDLLARFQKLKQQTSEMEQKLQCGQQPCV